MNDPRIAAVEDNLLRFYADVLSAPLLQVADLDGARGYFTDIPFPLCNVVFDARFAPDRAAEQARAVLENYTARGLPFLWWAGPSTTSPELEAACLEAGMIRQPVPGMHRPLDGPVEVPAPEGVELRMIEPDDLATLTDVMLTGFEMPEWLHDPLTGMFGELDPAGLVHVLARSGGEPVACGSAYLVDGTAGLYNIATLDAFRGRGLGYAVTAALMAHARERGCSEAVLHSSPMGFAVYQRLGFETVCELQQFVWLPQP